MPRTDPASPVERLLDAFRATRPIRAGSLIITVFGDVVAPRGGATWLGGLIELLEPFGINERQVRTSVYRLVQDGWLASEPIGRRSLYRITARGRQRFEHATRRIYGGPRTDWDGRVTQVLAPGLDGTARDALRRELGWLGFGALAPNTWIHPAADHEALRATLADLDVERRTVVVDGHIDRSADPETLRRLADDAWALASVAERYATFTERFEGVHRTRNDDASALVIRILLVHEYRKALLRDPQLPPALLPQSWIGQRAFAMSRAIYARVRDRAERAIDARLGCETGALPAPDDAFYARFGIGRARD